MTAWNPLIRALVRHSFDEIELNALLPHMSSLTDSGSTPLHYAALRKDVRFVRFLVLQGLAVDSQNAYGETALHWAVKAGHQETVRFLVSFGADPGRLDTETNSPRDWAVEEEQTHLVLLLRPARKGRSCRS